MILLACAVERELGSYRRRSGVDVLVTGVGPVEAACAVSHRLAQQRYRLVVSAGIAGALGDAARVGDGVALADDAFALDLEDGRPLALPDGERVIDRVRSDPALLAKVVDLGLRALQGVTVARVTASEETAARLAKMGAEVETMENFAVLRAAQREGVAAIGVRGISNRAGSRERSGWDFAAGVAGLARALDVCFAAVEHAREARP